MTPPRFPHSGTPGSLPACGSPRLFAACCALHRFPAPRHPPFALSSLTTIVLVSSWRISPGYTRVSPYSVVKDLMRVLLDAARAWLSTLDRRYVTGSFRMRAGRMSLEGRRDRLSDLPAPVAP
jgi:hypothetical protein